MTPILAATAPDVVTFVVAALMVLAGALGVVASRNPVHAALSLVLTLSGVAVLFIEQDAQFLAAAQVIVYTGAIVVLFLFVIMLLGVDKADAMARDRIPATKFIGVIAGLTTFLMLGFLVRWSFEATGASSQGGTINGPGSNVAKLADSLFTQYVFAFEATALLLVIVVVGAVVLARRPGSETDAEIDLGGTSPEDDEVVEDDELAEVSQ